MADIASLGLSCALYKSRGWYIYKTPHALIVVAIRLKACVRHRRPVAHALRTLFWMFICDTVDQLWAHALIVGGINMRHPAQAKADPAVRFIVAVGHRPWYSSVTIDWPLGAPKRVQAAFEPLLHAAGVDLWLCGHKHFYERTVPAFAGRPTANGTVHVVNGAAGNNEGLQPGHAPGKSKLIVASDYTTTGYGELSLLNATALRWRYLRSADGATMDEFVLRHLGSAY